MKKTLISLVLVFALLSTCVFSAVFAAYSVTSGVQTMTATVSAFGITAVTVNQDASLKEMVPGKLNVVLAKTSITGTPKVDAQLKYTGVTLTKSGNWTSDGKTLDTKPENPTNSEYFPIEFTVGAVTYGLYGTTVDGTYVKCNNFDDLASKVKTAIEALTIEVPVSGFQSANFTDMPIVTWSWVDRSNASDNKIPDGAGISLSLTATVTQKPVAQGSGT